MAVKDNMAPRWATQPLHDLLDEIGHLQKMMMASAKGLMMLKARPSIMTFSPIGQVDPELLAEARDDADFASKESDSLYPTLAASAAIALWAYLEAGIRHLLASWLENDPTAFDHPKIQDLRVRLGEYEKLQGEDRYYYILKLIEQAPGAPLKSGINRFELMLSLFKLNCQIDQDVTRDLLELNQIRNCLLHRAGRIDSQLASACPWMGLEIGEKVIVHPRSLGKYLLSVLSYVSEILMQVKSVFGEDVAEERIECSAKLRQCRELHVNEAT